MPPRKDFSKPKNFKASLLKMLSSLKKYKFIVIVALICAVASTILTLVGPNIISDITNAISNPIKEALEAIQNGAFITRININIDLISRLGTMLAIIYSASLVLGYLQSFIMTTVTQKVSYNLRSDIAAKINKLPLKYLDSHAHGDVLSRVTNDVDTISSSLDNSLITVVTSVVLLFGSVIMMFITNWIMAFSAIFATIFGFVLMSVIMSRSQKYFKARQEALGELNANIEEVYSAHNVVKAYNAESDNIKKFEEINKKLYNSNYKSQFYSGLMMPLMNFIGNFGYVVVCIVGAVLLSNNIITDFGVITAFMIYVRLFTQPFTNLAQCLTSLQSAGAASERVFEFMSENELSNQTQITNNLTDIHGNVTFKNVSFGYTPEKEIIHNFSIDISAGSKVAIVGPTGAGKTTIVNLLMKFYEVNSGDILIDGVSISDLTRENVHELFSMVLQDTNTFTASIMDNIKFGEDDISDQDVINACKVCGLHHFIKTLPLGYNTILDETTTLSSGQKQLLTIARAMVENAPMLILDEATSSVDTRTEKFVQEAMDKLTQSKTSFVIAHRLSTIKNSDIILVMQNGNIVETGNHNQLLAKNGFYASLYNSQFEEV